MTDTTKPNDSNELTEAELDKIAGAGLNAGGINGGVGGFQQKKAPAQSNGPEVLPGVPAK
jgi:hypothetical protein